MDQVVKTAKSQIDEFKRQKYHFDTETGECNLPEDAKSDYDNALKILSEQLYSKDIHFIFELIQNAEDNHYGKIVTPELSFELLEYDPTNTPGCTGCLVIKNNENGFDINNIKAISSIGKSTKANQKDAGYIGEKGIGFKSVFVVSPAPHILSNGFQIKFLKDDPKTGLGYIVPYWLEDDLSKFYNGNGTTLLLPLQNKQGSESRMFDKVQHELSKLSPELVLFLRKLKKLSIKTPNYYADYHLTKDGDYVELNTQSSSQNTSVKYLLKSQTISVPADAVNELRENVTKRDISIAFPVNFELEESPLYCYLPTESETGLPFLVNADFILSASRESIRQDLTWNNWMRGEVANFAAKTISKILSQKGDISRWAWVPVFGSNRVIYWNNVRERVEEALKVSKCIPTLSGQYELPSKVLSLGNTYGFLHSWPLSVIERFPFDLFWDDSSLISRVSSAIGLKSFGQKDFVSFLGLIKSDDDLSNDDLMPAIVEVTQQKGQWGSAKKYDSYLSQLRSCHLFKCESGLQNSKYKNLFLPSEDKHEVPVLVNGEGENTQPNYIDKTFFNIMPPHIKTSVKLMFNVDEVHAVSYLESSVVGFLKHNKNSCTEESLEALSKYLVENIDDLPVETLRALKSVLPFKSADGKWVTPLEHTRYVVPLSENEHPLWQKIYTNADELKHIIVLCEDYVNWVDEDLASDFFSALEISDHVTPFVISVNESPKFKATPRAFLDTEFWTDEDNRKRAYEWLYRVYSDDEIIKSEYKSNFCLSYFLLEEPWLLSTSQGFVKPSPTLHCFSESERGYFGSSLNYLKDNVSKVFAKKLGLITEPTPKGFMDQIKAQKSKDKVDVDFLILAYDALSNWKDPGEAARIQKRLSLEKLIYLNEPRDEWVAPENSVWENISSLGASFVGLSSYLPEKLRFYTIDTLGVKERHGIESYYSAYQVLAKSNKPLSKEEKDRLNRVVRHINTNIRSEEFVQDVQWSNFAKSAKVYTDIGTWLSHDKQLYVADDGKIKRLFEDHRSVNFTWSSATEFFTFFEGLGVKKASENITVTVSGVSGLNKETKVQITGFAKKAICLFIADNLSLDDEIIQQLANFYQSKEYGCEQLTVRYSLGDTSHVEVKTELGVYDPAEPALILVNDNDIEDIKDELAQSIARYFFGKRANTFEKSIRVFIDIHSESRLGKIVQKENLELDDSKTEIIERLFNEGYDVEQAIEGELHHDSEDSDTSELQNDQGNDNEITQSDAHSEDIIDESPLDKEGDEEAASAVYEQLSTTEDYSEPSAVESHDKTSSAIQENEEAENDLYREPVSSGDDYFRSNGSTGQKHEASNSFESSNAQRPENVTEEYNNKENLHEGSSGSSSKSGVSNTSIKSSLSLKKNNGSSKMPKSNGEYFSPDNESTQQNNSERANRQSPGYRLFSYVESDKTHERSEREQRDDQLFGSKAESYVKKWLEEQSYVDVELLGGVNKGFDIQAVDPESGEIIFVEVKGQRGAWNRTGIAMSKSQMEKCLTEGDNYWLIVVENLLTTPTINKFVNPAKLIDRYYFDSNWSKVAELLKTPEPKEIDIDDLFIDETSKNIYISFQSEGIVLPTVGYEISNENFEVIAELEFAWPELKIGIYFDEPENDIDGWNLFSIEDVEKDTSAIYELVNKG